ncbi:glycosyltransferase [Luteimonas sp. e5]
MSFLHDSLLYRVRQCWGLLRRGLASLRARGWKATWQRVTMHFGVLAPSLHQPLYLPGTPADVGGVGTLPAAAEPVASIIIPVFGQLPHTLRCLNALAEHPPAHACEVIVVDDASADGSADELARVAGLRLLRRAENGGFIDACNDGASAARGRFLVFLNNDTAPQPGWLDALIDTFEQRPQAGLVGAQLLYPDGRLQESGAALAADGSAENLGRFAHPDDPRHAALREVDYCSGAAIALPRTLFEALQGFDTHYRPAYYEDSDLAMRVRARDLQVLVQPAARVVHWEGTTGGTDTTRGSKAWQPVNREKFRQRWHDVLHARAGRPRPPRVLVVDATTPTPDRDSASLRMRGLLGLLLEEGAEVQFAALDRRHAGPYTRALQRSGVEAWHAPFLRSWPAWFKAHGAELDLVILSRHFVASELLPLVRRHAPQARVVFDSVDLHYLREGREAELGADRAARRRAARTRRRELAVIAASDLTLVVSPAEQALLRTDAPDARVAVLSNLHELADGGKPFAERRDVVFVGGFRHPPNVDAVLWFAAEIWPAVRATLGDVHFDVVGMQPPDAIRALDGRDGIRVLGYVPDIDPWMDGARVAVAPLRFGAGVKGKINLSMAHGQPVVATACAAEGMYLTHGHDVLVAEDAGAFADAVITLYRDQELWQRLADNGRENIRRHFSADAARGTVRRMLDRDKDTE